jgi:hypothetical protein
MKKGQDPAVPLSKPLLGGLSARPAADRRGETSKPPARGQGPQPLGRVVRHINQGQRALAARKS